jgi:hypothetical protein
MRHPIPYDPSMILKESNVGDYKIYILKHPTSGDVFYVGQTVQSLESRLNGHIYSKECNPDKVRYIKEICDSGQKPIIQLVESFKGTCYIQKLELNEKEIKWVRHFNDKGCTLLNVSLMEENAKCAEYHHYLSRLASGITYYYYYLCGISKYGQEVYDFERIKKDGFLPPGEIQKQIYNSRYDPWTNERFLKSIHYDIFGTGLSYVKCFNDLNPDYYDDDY